MEQDYPLTNNEKVVKRSCGKMNKLTNLLKYDSFRWAVVCWGWHLDYPDFYSAVLKVDPDSWDHLMVSFDEFFFNNRVRRDQYLKLFNDMDKAGALDDFATFLGAVTENNLNSLLHGALSQALYQKEGGLKKTTFFKIMDILKADQESIIRFEKLYKATNKALRGDNKNLTPVFKDLVHKEDFRKKRIAVIDQLFQSFSRSGLTRFDQYFINSFLSYKNEEGNYWPHQWINQLTKDPGPLLKLLAYDRVFNPTAALDFNNMQALTPSISCQRNGRKGDYFIDTDKVFRTFIERLANDNLMEFIDFINREFADIHLSDAICDVGRTICPTRNQCWFTNKKCIQIDL